MYLSLLAETAAPEFSICMVCIKWLHDDCMHNHQTLLQRVSTSNDALDISKLFYGNCQLFFKWQVAIVTGLGAAPWVVKPVYGFLSDTVPIFGYRRRSYLIICGLLGKHQFGQRHWLL